MRPRTHCCAVTSTTMPHYPLRWNLLKSTAGFDDILLGVESRGLVGRESPGGVQGNALVGVLLSITVTH